MLLCFLFFHFFNFTILRRSINGVFTETLFHYDRTLSENLTSFIDWRVVQAFLNIDFGSVINLSRSGILIFYLFFRARFGFSCRSILKKFGLLSLVNLWQLCSNLRLCRECPKSCILNTILLYSLLWSLWTLWWSHIIIKLLYYFILLRFPMLLL